MNLESRLTEVDGTGVRGLKRCNIELKLGILCSLAGINVLIESWLFIG
jgi:hypothetical protein